MSIFRATLYAVIALVTIALVVALYTEWRGARADRAMLASQLAATEKILAGAAQSQKTRDTQLKDTLAQIAERASKVSKPADIARELTREAALPKPITIEELPQGGLVAPQEPAGPPDAPNTEPQSPADHTGAPAEIPAEDLKPLYSFVMDCKTCQANLSSAQGDLADEKTKTAALTRERDAALRTARGGGFWRRAARAAKWFAIGAGVGAAAAAVAHH
ncbi:MAG: hypothetical protein ABSF92_01350 [Candidatus Acidiferrales bacterium]|jgi:hypothetical protein